MRHIVVPAVGLVGILLVASVPLQSADAIVNPVGGPFKLQQVASGLNNALLVTHAGDGSGRAFVVRQTGQIHTISSTGTVDLWFDLSSRVVCCGERGLLGLAFHPDFESNGKFFASYTRAGDGWTAIEKFTMPNPLTGKPALSQGQVILTWYQPFSNHNGGGIHFSPVDGYLYIGMGDGGSGGDPGNRAQNNNDLLGKMLRIDVDVPSGYAIPDGNPFKNGGGRPEIWSKGLRNPWRWSFDRDTGDMWVADVGQNFVEEVNFEPPGVAGRNYGWRAFEGHYPYNPSQALGIATQVTFPVYEYVHFAGQGAAACSITGGYVYRGSAMPWLEGMYFFGDYCSGLISMMPAATAVAGVGAPVPVFQLTNLFSLGSFGEDEAGELYVPLLNGVVYKMVPPV